MKSVLIAHQSRIPHYRVPFYNFLERERPKDWRFDVVFDRSMESKQRFYDKPISEGQFDFPLLEANSFRVDFMGKQLTYQFFWRKAAGYDLIIVEHALNNLTYPLCQIHQIGKTKFAYWGHGRDRSATNPSLLKLLLEWIKIILARNADGYFAYTPKVRDFLIQQGLSPGKVFSVNNTIVVGKQREIYRQLKNQREDFRKHLGLEDQTVLLFVGRFTKRKRLKFLMEMMEQLNQMTDDFHLLLVGSGDIVDYSKKPSNVSFLGSILDLEELAPIYIASDLYVYPGSVGLAPLQALCYDLPVIWIEAANHMPEVEYLSEKNSLMLKHDINTEGYAKAILALIQDNERINSFREDIWETIKHLSMKNMVSNFITGINTILAN